MHLPRAIPLLIHAPTAPDFYQCDPSYGRNIKPLDCQLGIEWDWPSGKTPIHYYFEDPSPSNSIKVPRIIKEGSCNVAIEPAGPRYGKAFGYASYLSHSPDKMRALAGYVIEKCANQNQGMGGFVTVGIDAAESYVRAALNEPWEDAQDRADNITTNGAFLTISINGEDRTAFMPGDTDPWVPAYLSKYAARLAQLNNEKLMQFQAISFIYHWFAERMGRGGNLMWTTPPSLHFIQQQFNDHARVAPQPDVDPEIQGRLMQEGKMVYQCDATVGAPNPLDCEKLSYSLQSPDTIESLKAGVPKFFSEGTCALGISSPIPITITWAHILAAFSTLNNLCVQNPISAAKGGKAYYGSQGINSWINGKRDSVGGVNGTDALPVGINATIFRHETNMPCEWVLAQEALCPEDGQSHPSYSESGVLDPAYVEGAILTEGADQMVQYLKLLNDAPILGLLIRSLPLPIHRPTPPDRWFCHQDYGYNIVPLDCQKAIDDNWPAGKTPIHYHILDPSPSNSVRLPQTHRFGSCTVSLETAGPDYPPPNYSIPPDHLRALGGFLIETCASQTGLGGFITHGFEAAQNYIAGEADGNFLTITISGTDDEFQPGNTDPNIASYLSNYAANLSTLPNLESSHFMDEARRLRDRALDMIRGGDVNWWFDIDLYDVSKDASNEGEMDDTASSRMTYLCDSDLGSPRAVDCEKLAWTLQPLDVNLKPETPNIYTSGTCALGISSTVATTITWAHLLAAFESINNMCVQDPIRVSGGRAQSVWIHGRDVVNETQLPSGVNATVWKHSTADVNCEWQLAMEGKDISECER